MAPGQQKQISDPQVATAVINEAKSGGVFKGEMPQDDAGKLTTAQELYGLALQAQATGVRGNVVSNVIALAEAQGEAPQQPEDNGAANPFAPPAQPSAPAPSPEPAQQPAAQTATTDDIESIIPDYDDLKVSEILEAMESLTAEQIEAVKAYEASEGERAKILNYVPPPETQQAAPSASEPPAVQPQQPVSSDYVSVDPSEYPNKEPWPGYNKQKIPQIVETAQNLIVADQSKQRDILAHIWGYESANKERTRLLNKLKEIGENGVQVSPPTQPEPDEPGVDSTPPFQQTTGAAVSSPPVSSVPDPATPEFDEIVPPLEGATQLAQGVVAREGLPIPAHPSFEGEPPSVPANSTKLSDLDVSRLQSEFNACFARAYYLLSIAEGHANDAKLMAESLIDRYIRDTEFPKGTTVTQMEAKASEAPEVHHARRVQHQWNEVARQYRALQKVYESTCERLSREQTRREGDRQHTGR